MRIASIRTLPRNLAPKRNLENPTTPPTSKRSHTRFIEGDQGGPQETPVENKNGNNIVDEGKVNENSNDSFDFQALTATAPNLAVQLMSSRVTVKKGLALTYYGPLGILDDQET